ncbi:MAG: oligosaccharide flippase family protein [Muribaculaceae bacterium]|nr:oligosaccharide flippase family protein [Muribaculaceae bacterium]
MRFRTAIIWNGISQFGQSGITLLSTIILARLLTPDDFGLVGIVTIFIDISQIMVDSEM